jgi:hypothetical protein
MQAPASATPLADRLGLPAWLLDLLTAALGSVAANGSAVGLIAFAAHHRQRNDIEIAEIVDEPRCVLRPTEHAAQFAVEALRKGGRLEIIRLHGAYRIWCGRNCSRCRTTKLCRRSHICSRRRALSCRNVRAGLWLWESRLPGDQTVGR